MDNVKKVNYFFTLHQVAHNNVLLQDTGISRPTDELKKMVTLFGKIFQEKIYGKIDYYKGMHCLANAAENKKVLFTGKSKFRRTQYHNRFFIILQEWWRNIDNWGSRSTLIGRMCNLLYRSDHMKEVIQMLRLSKKGFKAYVRKVWFEGCKDPHGRACLFQHYYLGHKTEERLTGIHGWDGLIFLSRLEDYNCYLQIKSGQIYLAQIEHNGLWTTSTVHIGLPFDFEMLLITVLAIYSTEPEHSIDLGLGEIGFTFRRYCKNVSTMYFKGVREKKLKSSITNLNAQKK